MTGRFYQPQMRIACRRCDRRGYYYLGGFTKEAPPFFVLSHFSQHSPIQYTFAQSSIAFD